MFDRRQQRRSSSSRVGGGRTDESAVSDWRRGDVFRTEYKPLQTTQLDFLLLLTGDGLTNQLLPPGLTPTIQLLLRLWLKLAGVKRQIKLLTAEGPSCCGTSGGRIRHFR